tara:strand:+ start:108 stop:536 length:429 start_codon:yes stop_codon:yes gene_type:complete
MNSLSKQDQLFRELFPHSIGLDRLFSQLSKTGGQTTGFPPYNIISDDNKTYIELALAGYSKDDIEVIVEDGTLSINGRGYSERVGGEDKLSHKGIASRRFVRQFTLGEYIEIKSAELKNGLLTITLEEVLPLEKQPKVIDIK